MATPSFTRPNVLYLYTDQQRIDTLSCLGQEAIRTPNIDALAADGALLTQYQGYADVSMGRGAIVIGLAAVIIGEVLFGRIFRNFATKLIAVSIGAIIYYIVMQVVLWLGLPTNYLKLLTALVVAMFLAVPHWKSQLFTARSARKGEKQNA